MYWTERGELVNELSLFTGAGGGILGTHLLGWRPIGYVEWDDYCQRIIAARVRDGLIPAAPIFGDVREFAQSGAAEQYRGFADVVTAGFPCQPHSVAGKRLGADDERDMWPATAAVIRAVRPRSVLLENVPGILTGYAARVTADLAGMGYVGRTGCISAADTGANHLRRRWWVAAVRDADKHREPNLPISAEESGLCDVAYASGAGLDFRDMLGRVSGQAQRSHCGQAAELGREAREREELAYPERFGQSGSRKPELSISTKANGDRKTSKSVYVSIRREWPVEPDVGRVANGVSSRVDRLKAIGNGQVPRVVAAAWRLLK